jgi:hypothetical protein
MSAEIIDFVKYRAARGQNASVAASQTLPPLATDPVTSAAFLFWTGASGARYVHSVYNLFECPPVEQANYVLVKRHETGQRTVVSIGRASNASPSLNLAEIRQRSAELGANEVHIHLLAGGQAEGQRIEADLRGSLVLA